MINSVHARRRLIRWLRCCDLCDEAEARGAISAVRVDTWEPFRFLLLGEGFLCPEHVEGHRTRTSTGSARKLCQYLRCCVFRC